MFDFNFQVNAIMQNQAALNTYFGNLQNQFTPGYKADTIQFADMMGGMGTKSAKVRQAGIQFTQGMLADTGVNTQLAINGNGFFAVSDGNRTHFTRDGRFDMKDGQLVNPEGKAVLGYSLDASGAASSTNPAPIKLDRDANGLYGGKYVNVHFDTDSGKLYGTTQGVTDPTTGQTQPGQEVPIAQVAMASFANSSGLSRSGNTTFVESENSGKPVFGVAGTGALGQVMSGKLEMSNVDFAQQASLIGMAKQNYEANFAAFKAMDKLAETAIGLVR